MKIKFPNFLFILFRQFKVIYLFCDGHDLFNLMLVCNKIKTNIHMFVENYLKNEEISLSNIGNNYLE